MAHVANIARAHNAIAHEKARMFMNNQGMRRLSVT